MKGLRIISNILGWSYFWCWSISFIPQVVLNYERKSVVGMSFEYQLLNLIGFSSYAVYCCCLQFDTSVRKRYKEAFHSATLVTIQDVAFALWATVGTAATLSQIFIYERGTQRFGRFVLTAVLIVLIFTFIFGILVLQYAPSGSQVHGIPLISFLAFLYWLSIVKLGVTLSKYLPQALLNYKRKSTVGWSISNVLLDFSGGLLSVLQLLVDGYSRGWSGLIGDPIKFGLGFISMIFDIIFMLQHYVFYCKKSEDLPERTSFSSWSRNSLSFLRASCSRLLSTITEENSIDVRTTNSTAIGASSERTRQGTNSRYEHDGVNYSPLIRGDRMIDDDGGDGCVSPHQISSSPKR
mmetsp:Transcript_20473/g.26536  ORF Transcript_20473/g.26536 Transcript_20473/m.26536 type:complete len:351 (+) Transcript_20473:1479-2531(+)